MDVKKPGLPTPAMFIDDPEWASFLPETNDVQGRRKTLPSHDDCSRIEPEDAAEHLRIGGTLGSMPGYEERPGQIDMLKAVAAAFNMREHLMIEAGTGVGKSLAYLVPSILWAWTNDTPVVIATATRNLQSQLMRSDIPRAIKILGEDAGKFRVSLLKGRSNYLCLRAVDEFFAAGYWTMSDADKAEMPHFIQWLHTTTDGDLDTYDGLPRTLLACSGEECSGRRCRHYSRCFVVRARKKALEAHLVVANHALVLGEASGGAGSILPAYGRLVLDEAHNLEDAATDFLSAELSIEEMSRLLGRLSRKNRRAVKGAAAISGGTGALAAVERHLKRGMLASSDDAARIMKLVQAAHPASMRILDATDALLSTAARLLRPATGSDIIRFKTHGGVRRYFVRGLMREYAPGEWDECELADAEAKFENEVAGLVRILHGLRDAINNATPDGEFNYLADISTQIDGIAENLVCAANEAHFVLAAEKDDYAYWVEKRPVRGAAMLRKSVRIVAAPLSVADCLERLVYSQKDSVILSSATLRVGNDFGYMARRLGCRERFRMMTAASPFDYLLQCRVLACDFLPDPSDGVEYIDALAPLLKDVFSSSGARALALFTSYEMMNAVAAKSRAALADEGIELMVQGEGLSRETMADALRKKRGVVLFGSQSFWEGVDVSGEALSCVVITRLPFANASDPIVEARAEKIERDGGRPFRDYTLPEAVIKFRQGFGRLVRSKRDRGVVVVTDPRFVTKNYGSTFRRSVPASIHTVADASELVRRIEDFMAI